MNTPTRTKNNKITAGLLESAFTFKNGFTAKLSFLLLNQVDLILTVFAMSLGLSEINPFMRDLFMVPIGLIIAKCIIPLLLAWVIPGKLLIPAIILLFAVIGWDIKELIKFFV